LFRLAYQGVDRHGDAESQEQCDQEDIHGYTRCSWTCAAAGSRTTAAARCRDGHNAMTVPRMTTGPDSHIHHTRGFTSNRNAARCPSGWTSLNSTYTSSTGVERMAARVESMRKLG